MIEASPSGVHSDRLGTAQSIACGSWDALPMMVMEFAKDGRLIAASTAFQTVCARPIDALLDHGWHDAFTSEDRAELLACLAAQSKFALLLQLVSADALTTRLYCAGVPTAQGTICIFHDLSNGKVAELSVRSQTEQFRLLADHVPAQIAYYEAQNFRCVFANQDYAKFFGHTSNSILGKSIEQIVGVDGANEVRPHMERMLSTKAAVTYERHFKVESGECWIEVNLLPHLDSNGNTMAVFALMMDQTKRKLAARKLEESEQRLNKFMAASVEGIVFHKDGVITDANPPILRLLGYSLEEIAGRTTAEFIAPDRRVHVQSVVKSRAQMTYESALVHKSGEHIPVEFVVRSMLHKGETQRMTIVRDIRDRLRARERITFLAHHDPLTGLPNRTSFMEKLGGLIDHARAGNTSIALLFIDLDHFKRVNDSLGHMVGDALLKTVACRITSGLRTSDLVARFGGDEFVVVIPATQGRSDVEQIATKLLQLIEAPLDIDGRNIAVTPSLGVAVFPEHGQTPEDLLKHADAAMYLAKSRGRANYQFFNEDLAKAAYSTIELEGQLAQAVQNNQFVLYFQPQVRCDDGGVCGAEALLRWLHPQRGLVGPDEFIPLAEQRRIIVPIGYWVLRQAAKWSVALRQAGLATLPVAVNLSSIQFQAEDFVETLTHVLQESGLPGQLLELEITERMLMEDLPTIRSALEQIKALGVKVSVDDFGTGFSSLGRLKELPIDRLKIDRSFVSDLPTNRGSKAIAQAIVNMGHSLGLAVIAEGVETPAQVHCLTELGCDELQGYVIAKPMPAAQFERWLTDYRGRASRS